MTYFIKLLLVTNLHYTLLKKNIYDLIPNTYYLIPDTQYTILNTQNLSTKRNRTLYLILIISTMLLGLASRKFSYLLPSFIADYSGDTLWALMVYFLICFIFSEYSILQVAIISLAFSFLIEFSQLYQAGWINAVRHTKIGGLVLGFGFLWSDLLCYTAGVFIGILTDLLLMKKEPKS